MATQEQFAAALAAWPNDLHSDPEFIAVMKSQDAKAEMVSDDLRESMMAVAGYLESRGYNSENSIPKTRSTTLPTPALVRDAHPETSRPRSRSSSTRPQPSRCHANLRRAE